MQFFGVLPKVMMCLDERVSDSVCSVQMAFRRIALLQNKTGNSVWQSFRKKIHRVMDG
jgi:hypothetical protein